MFRVPWLHLMTIFGYIPKRGGSLPTWLGCLSTCVNLGLLLSISSDCQYSLSSDQVTLSSKLPSTPSRTCLRILVGIIPFSVFLVSCLGHVPPLTMAWVCGCPPLIVFLFLYTCVAVPEIDRKRLSTEPFMATYLNTFLSTLLVIPVSATHECLPLF